MVALLGTLGAFFSSSRARMTERAVGDEPVAWQVQLAPNGSLLAAQNIVRRTPGVSHTSLVGYAAVSGMDATVMGAVQQTGAGVVLGLSPRYPEMFPGEVRYLLGAHEGVLLAQQAAANLHATVNTEIRILLARGHSLRFRVDGIVDLPQADSMFQNIGASAGSTPQAPPDNVVMLPLGTWKTVFHPTDPGVRLQIHTDIAGELPADPGAAFAVVQQRANRLEAQLAGAGIVGDNLGARLDAAREDATYAQLLFLFLGLPGVLLAGIVVVALVSTGAERRRAEQALLRLRGASPASLVRVALSESMLVWLLGVAAGTGGALLTSRILFGGVAAGATFPWLVGAMAIALAVTSAAMVVPALRDARALSVRSARSLVTRPGQPLVLRAPLDAILLAVGSVVYWRAVKSGYRVVLAPEGVPTISVDYFTLIGPLCFWLGGALLAWRLCLRLLKEARRWMPRPLRMVAGSTAGLTAASLARQPRVVARAAVGVGLAFAFAVSTAVFNTTYAHQARIDAQLTNGADVAVATTTLEGLPPTLAQRALRVPGVAAVETMQHRFAYVGNDLQDLYGIDPHHFGGAAPLSDAYFAGVGAREALAELARTPDGVLVSDETARDFQLQAGDLLRLRLQFASDHAYHIVSFHYLGIVREFPTAPRDSFIVANDAWVSSHTGAAGAQVLLVRSGVDPRVLASRFADLLPPASGLQVTDLADQLRTTLSGLVAIDVRGITRVELVFALVLSVAITALVLALGLGERRQMFAIARALGARTRALASFAVGEGAFMTLVGGGLGIVGGAGIALVLVKTLTGVFDPPPSGLAVPLGYLAVVIIASLIATVLAAAWTLRKVDIAAALRR